MRAWGFDYEQLRKIKPDIIMLSSCLMGQTGPIAKIAVTAIWRRPFQDFTISLGGRIVRQRDRSGLYRLHIAPLQRYGDSCRA